MTSFRPAYCLGVDFLEHSIAEPVRIASHWSDLWSSSHRAVSIHAEANLETYQKKSILWQVTLCSISFQHMQEHTLVCSFIYKIEKTL